MDKLLSDVRKNHWIVYIWFIIPLISLLPFIVFAVGKLVMEDKPAFKNMDWLVLLLMLLPFVALVFFIIRILGK